MDRYYCPDISTSQPIVLPDDQTHHALHVMRLRDGELVELFDGQGRFVAARAVVKRKLVHFEITGVERWSPLPPFQLHIATAVPKSDRSEQLVDSASQLGVHTLTWINCERSSVRLDEHSGKMMKWQRVAVESAKQCRRNWLMQIEAPVQLGDYARWCRHPKILADPAGPVHLGDFLQEEHRPPAMTIFIGPEGGFSPDEIQLLLAAGCRSVSLGVNILRVEAAVAAAAAIMGKWCMPPLP